MGVGQLLRAPALSHFLRLGLILLALAAYSGADAALPEVEGFPNQPIQIIVYTSPGGLIDVTARRFARLAEEHAGHPFAVVNRPGGGGIVAFEEALREPADGHRLLAVTRSNISKLVASGRQDLIASIDWHTHIMDNPHVVISKRGEGPRDWAELLAWPEQKWLGVDIGGVKHISGVKIAEQAALDARWIPYGSGGEAMAALLGGLGTVYLGNPRDAFASEQLEVIAVAAAERLADLPAAPTLDELGMPGLETELIWRGFALREGVSEPVRAWYAALMNQVLSDPRWISAWEGEAVRLQVLDSQAFTALVQRDQQAFTQYLTQLGLIQDAALHGRTRLGWHQPGVWALLVIGLGTVILPVLLGRTSLRSRRAELTLLWVLAAPAVYGLSLLPSLPPASVIDPIGARGLLALWSVLLLGLLVASLVLPSSRLVPAPADPSSATSSVPSLWQSRLPLTFVMVALYLLMVPRLGYLLATLIYMPALMWALGYRKPLPLALLTLFWLVMAELLFRQVLLVPLPRAVW